jgi:hypothetical protein
MEAAIIAATCPRCGSVELEPGDIALVRSPREALAWYMFDCTGCASRVVKDASGAVSVALMHVDVTVWVVPAEVLEREPGERIAMDDVLDAVLALQGDCDVVALAEGAAA